MADREWILLNPGPANTTATVRAALVMPDLCHREPEYFDMMRRCRTQITRLAGCGDDWTTVLFTGSGTAAVEAARDFLSKTEIKKVHVIWKEDVRHWHPNQDWIWASSRQRMEPSAPVISSSPSMVMARCSASSCPGSRRLEMAR